MKEESKESSDGAASPLEEEEFENKEEKKKRRPRRVRKVCPPLLWIPIGGKDCPPRPQQLPPPSHSLGGLGRRML